MTNDDLNVTLSDGSGVAVIRPPGAVPERKRRAVLEVAGRAGSMQGELALVQQMVEQGNAANVVIPNQAEMFELLSDLGTALIVAFVRSWPYGDVTADVLLDEVPSQVFDQLRGIVFPLFPHLVQNFTADGAMTVGADGQPVRDPASPTQPSAA